MSEITPDPPTLDDVVRLYVLATCLACGWNMARTAAVLGVAHKTVYNHLNRYMVEGYVEKTESGRGWRLKAKLTETTG